MAGALGEADFGIDATRREQLAHLLQARTGTAMCGAWVENEEDVHNFSRLTNSSIERLSPTVGWGGYKTLPYDLMW